MNNPILKKYKETTLQREHGYAVIMNSMFIKSTYSILPVAIVLLGTGCAHVPTAVQNDEVAQVSVADIQHSPAKTLAQPVRWGGTIVDVSNRENFTDIVVVSRPLDRNSRPMPEQLSEGRFIARLAGFGEPEDYANGREVTVTGILENIEVGEIGQTTYSFPIVEVSGIHLWRKRTSNDSHRYPHYYHHPHYPYHGHHPWWWHDDHHHRNGVSGYIGISKEL